MILLSELSRRRIRSINKLVRVGRDECAVVLRVDKEKGYIDLSKRRLSDDEKRRCENKFEKVRSRSMINDLCLRKSQVFFPTKFKLHLFIFTF